VYHRRLECTDLERNNISSEDQAKEIVLSADQVSLYQSPLCIATENENARVVDILLRYNADVNLRDATGRAALHYACENNDSELVKLLLMAGADPNLPTGTDVQLPFDVTYRLPLCIAAEHGNRKVVELLLQSQADICQQDGCGKTALHCAVKAAIRCRRNFPS
jgi:ankyrin repeat protein